jgi:hypothetical protein
LILIQVKDTNSNLLDSIDDSSSKGGRKDAFKSTSDPSPGSMKPEASRSEVVKLATFLQFPSLPVEMQKHVFRQHVHSDPPQIIYKGATLAIEQGPRPFPGPNSAHIGVLNAALCPDYDSLIYEPQIVEHIFHVTLENIEFLHHWTFPLESPVTKMLNVTIHIEPALNSEPNLRIQLQLARNFLLRFTSAVNMEVYFESFTASKDGIRSECGKSAHQALVYDFKDTLKTLPRLQSFVIFRGLSFDHHPTCSWGWRRKGHQAAWWIPFNGASLSSKINTYKDDEMRLFYEEQERKAQESRRREIREYLEQKRKKEEAGLSSIGIRVKKS